MAGELQTTIIGNLTDAPELRFTPSGAAVAKFTVASTPRFLDKASGEWKDGQPLFMTCSVWRDMAENAAESLSKGDRVIVVGRLAQENWEDKATGGKRSKIVLQVDELAPSLRYAEAKPVKKAKTGGSDPGAYRGGGGRSGDKFDDPWATSQAGAPRGGGKTSTFDEEPPF